MQPTFKLEMFAPQQQPQRAFGVYNPYMPTIELGENKKFSPAAFQYLSAPTSAVSWGPNVRIPMQQVYNITLPGPTGSHVEMSKIYEGVLPGKENKLTSTTLGERLQTYDYVRQILIKINEGEDISLDNDGHNSLMSYIKFMELNPNYYSPIHSNPYKGLPYGLLVYRSCFPIRFDEASQSVVCSKNSIGLNIRLYALTYAELYSYKFRQLIYKEYDVWRELAYYEYVRENIIKKKQSPNFPLLYSFFMSPNRNIDFFSLKKGCLTQKDFLTREYQRFVQVHTLFSKVQPSTEVIRPMSLPDAARKVIAKLPDEIDPTLQAYSGTTLILVTEAPHHNLYQWASRIYERDGIVRKMISHGYHNENVWIGILFQIVSALHIMQIHGIYIRNMTIEDNIYIKDLQNYGKAMGYWKYVINGISYYIPNYGYVVLVDSNFKDIEPAGATIERCKREYKIYTSDIIGKRYSMESIRKKVFENYRRIVSTNAFTKEHTQNNVNRPPESIMKLLESMMVDPEMDLGKVISKYFRPLMHNRIGTLLRKDTEIPNIREITGQFKNGELAIEVLEQDLFRWCMVVAQREDGIVEIITRDDPKSLDFISKEVRIETLKQYSASERVDQNTNPDVNLSEDELLETYVVSTF
ncbi:hypothetical protein QJ857_gp0791 [Tupanvirus soda lake]|uniref:Uncharacterized protein n=2 Tax=Tupanvirus TaxID=2094720 RepID=A0A6N1NUV2_9VIRU|nr:hypothetical protein QJ857_gp0791 [Tupanvirus soda lake]QKU35258.1 hypothetical protein [Tupanvirus soda lake]